MPERAQLWFRVDASRTIGAGHFMRCLSLAERWQDEGGEVRFVGSYPDELARRLAFEGIEHARPGAFWPDPADLEETLRLLPPGVPVVIDGYGFDAEYHERIGGSGRRVMVIDDIAHLSAYAGDLLLNFNICAEKVAYERAPERRLLGPRYVPLRRGFAVVERSVRSTPRTATRLLVTLGGADPTGATPRVLEALSGPALAGTTIRVVAGPASSNRAELDRIAAESDGRFELLSDVSDMPGLMAWADFAVSAAGGTSWELAFMGLPCGLIAVAENQIPNVEGLLAWGSAIDLGTTEAAGDLAPRVEAILGDSEARARMSERGRELIDGQGAARVVAALKQPIAGLSHRPEGR